jgi:hypothetical protein
MSDGKSTFARLKYNNAIMKTTDFAPSSSSSFTIYLKHAARFSSLCPFNFQNPNILKLSTSVVSSGSSFTASFNSSLNPGTTVPYSITGCSSADLGGAVVSGGAFTAPYQSTTYSIAAGVAGRSIKFNISGGSVVTTLYVPNVVYTVSVSGGVYWLATGGAAAIQQPSITLEAGLMYVFDQSNASNVGNTLVLGQYRDATPYYTTNVVINGTAGSADAFTMVDLSGQTLPSPALIYFSRNTADMGPMEVLDATKYYAISNIISKRAGYADYMNLQFPTNTFYNTSFTIEFWIYFDGTHPQGNSDLVRLHSTYPQDSWSNKYYYLHRKFEAMAYSSYVMSNDNTVNWNTTNVWRHYACVYTYNASSTSIIRYFADGVFIKSSTNPTQTSINTTTNLNFPGTNTAFKGRIRHLRISTSVVYPATTSFAPSTELSSLASTIYLMRFSSSDTVINIGTNKNIITTPTGTITYGNS